jgi:hypothetical protein
MHRSGLVSEWLLFNTWMSNLEVIEDTDVTRLKIIVEVKNKLQQWKLWYFSLWYKGRGGSMSLGSWII